MFDSLVPKCRVGEACLLALMSGVVAGPAPAAADSPAGNHTAVFWGVRTVEKTEVPAVSDPSWPQVGIDRFILAALEEARLSPAPPADPRTLIRRATFDLTGLPPAPEEVEAFVRSYDRIGAERQHAFARLVDRLLASPRYGETWGRHWLDVARYADSNGLDENVAHGNAWRYRDWVIAAFNNDKPYDQFVTEQLAGDLLPSDDPAVRNERLIAVGFLSLGPKVLAEVDEGKMEMDIVDEQIDTVGKAFLALTLGCARCHDHKFDPVSQHDYYALAGIFKSTHTMESFTKIAKWHEHELWSAEYNREKESHEREVAGVKKAVDRLVADANDALRKQLGEAASFPKDPEPSYPDAVRDELKQLRGRLAELKENSPHAPTAMGVRDGFAADVALHLRGSHLRLGESVRRGFPAVLIGDRSYEIEEEQSGRRELARWITSPQTPAGRLAARVMVNRIWRWHFGKGLVETPDNFGKLGARPSNARLLDWLADEFVRRGWSIKSLHRTIMLSSTYQMSSRSDSRAAAADPQNQLLSRMNLRRLTAEQIRDTLLAVSGRLDTAMGGSLLAVENRKHIFDHTSKDDTNYDAMRRSVYLPVVRNNLHDALAIFDYMDASVTNGNRATSTVPAQALFVMNSDFVAASAAALADRLRQAETSDAQRICLLYELAYARPPMQHESVRMLQALAQTEARMIRESDSESDAQHRAWEWICHAVLASNEFLYIE